VLKEKRRAREVHVKISSNLVYQPTAMSRSGDLTPVVRDANGVVPEKLDDIAAGRDASEQTFLPDIDVVHDEHRAFRRLIGQRGARGIEGRRPVAGTKHPLGERCRSSGNDAAGVQRCPDEYGERTGVGSSASSSVGRGRWRDALLRTARGRTRAEVVIGVRQIEFCAYQQTGVSFRIS